MQSAQDRHSKGELFGTVKGIVLEGRPGEAEVDGAAVGEIKTTTETPETAPGANAPEKATGADETPAEEKRRKMLERFMAILAASLRTHDIFARVVEFELFQQLFCTRISLRVPTRN